MPRLLIVNRDLLVGGGITYMVHLAEALKPFGWDVELWCSPGPMLPAIRAAGIRWRPIPIFAPWQQGLVRSVLKRYGPFDAVTLQSFTGALVTAKACAELGIPCIATLHGPAPAKRVAEWQEVFAAVSSIVVLNESVFDFFKRNGAPEGKLALSRLPYHFREVPPTRSATKFVYCARLSRGRFGHVQTLLTAASKVDSIDVEVIGGGTMQGRLQTMCKQIYRRPVVFHGTCYKVPEILDTAAVAAGAGYVAIESLESGCAVIGIGFTGIFGLVTPERFNDASRCNFGDHSLQPLEMSVSEVAVAIEEAFHQAGSPENGKVRELARQTFSHEVVGRQMDQLLRSLKASATV